MGKKNYGKSVKTRLLNLMNETGYKFMTLLLIGHNLCLTSVNLNFMSILYVINFVQTIPLNQNVLIKIMQKPQCELYNELSANL